MWTIIIFWWYLQVGTFTSFYSLCVDLKLVSCHYRDPHEEQGSYQYQLFNNTPLHTSWVIWRVLEFVSRCLTLYGSAMLQYLANPNLCDIVMAPSPSSPSYQQRYLQGTIHSCYPSNIIAMTTFSSLNFSQSSNGALKQTWIRSWILVDPTNNKLQCSRCTWYCIIALHHASSSQTGTIPSLVGTAYSTCRFPLSLQCWPMEII